MSSEANQPLPSTAQAPVVDLSSYSSHFTLRNRMARALWKAVWLVAFRPSPQFLYGWRRFLLRGFGASISPTSVIHASVKVWAPWNLSMGDYACLGPEVNCYNVAPVSLGRQATVSQFAHLCTASHDITDPAMRLITRPIRIGADAWVCSGAFVSPGLSVGEGAVLAAMACLTKDLPPWEVWGGNPAGFLKPRQLGRGSK